MATTTTDHARPRESVDRILVVVPAQHDGSVTVIADDGEEVDVPIPASVRPGDTFEVLLAEASSSSSEDEQDSDDEDDVVSEQGQPATSINEPAARTGGTGSTEESALKSEHSESKMRRLTLENNMLSAAVQLYEQRAIEREAQHSLTMEDLRAHLAKQPGEGIQALAPSQQQLLNQSPVVELEQRLAEKTAALCATETALEEERSKAEAAQDEAVALRRQLAQVGAEVEGNRARADRCLDVVRKLQLRMDSLRLRAIDQGLELSDTWEAESEASHAATADILNEDAQRRENRALAGQAEAAARAEQAAERVRELENENARISAQLTAMEEARHTVQQTVPASSVYPAGKAGIAGVETSVEEDSLDSSRQPDVRQGLDQLSLSAITTGNMDHSAALEDTAQEDAARIKGAEPTANEATEQLDMHQVSNREYTDKKELANLFFLPEAPIHIQGQLKIAEEICTEAVAQRDAARAELKRQELERQQEQQLMEQFETRLARERAEEHQLASQVANELTSLREAVQAKDSVLGLAQVENGRLRSKVDQTQTYISRVQQHVVERAFRQLLDLVAYCFFFWSDHMRQAKRQRVHEQEMLSSSVRAEEAIRTSEEAQAKVSSIQTELAAAKDSSEQALGDFDRERDALLLTHEKQMTDLARLHEEQVDRETTRSSQRVAMAEEEVAAQQSALDSFVVQEEKHAQERIQVAAAQAEMNETLRQEVQMARSEATEAQSTMASRDETIGDLRAELQLTHTELMELKTSLESELQSTRAELVESASARRIEEEHSKVKHQESALAAAEKSGALAVLQMELESVKGSLARAENARQRQNEQWAAERQDLVSSYETQLDGAVAASKAVLATTNEDHGRQASAIEESLRVQANEITLGLRSQIDKLRASLTQSTESKEAATVAWTKERAELVAAHERQLMDQSLKTDELIDTIRKKSERHLDGLTEHIRTSLGQASEVAGELHIQLQQTRQDLTITPGGSITDVESVSAEWGRKLSDQMKAYSEQATEITDALRAQLASERKQLSRLVAEKESIQIAWAKERAELIENHDKQLLEQVSATDELLFSARKESQQRLAEALALWTSPETTVHEGSFDLPSFDSPDPSAQRTMSQESPTLHGLEGSPRTPRGQSSKRIAQLRQQLAETASANEAAMLTWAREKQELIVSFEHQLELKELHIDEMEFTVQQHQQKESSDFVASAPASDSASAKPAKRRQDAQEASQALHQARSALDEMRVRAERLEAELAQVVADKANTETLLSVADREAERHRLEVEELSAAEGEAERHKLALEEYVAGEEMRAQERMQAVEAQARIAAALRNEVMATKAKLAEEQQRQQSLATAAESEKAAAAQTIVAAKAEASKLRALLVDAQSAAATAAQTTTALRQELEKVREQDTATRLDLASTKSRLAQTQTENGLQSKKVARLEAELESARIRLTDVSSSLHSDLEATRTQLMQLQAQNLSTPQQSSSSSRAESAEASSPDSHSHAQDPAQFKRTSDEHKEMIALLRSQLDKSRAELTSLSNTLRGELQSARSDLLQARAEIDENAHQARLVQAELSEAKVSNETQSQTIEGLHKELETERAKLTPVSAELRGSLVTTKTKLLQAESAVAIKHVVEDRMSEGVPPSLELRDGHNLPMGSDTEVGSGIESDIDSMASISSTTTQVR